MCDLQIYMYMYSTRQTQGITHARFARRLHACRTPIVCPDGPRPYDARCNRVYTYTLVCTLASVRTFARHGKMRVFGLLCYDHASTTRLVLPSDHASTTRLVLPSMTTPQLQDLFGLL